MASSTSTLPQFPRPIHRVDTSESTLSEASNDLSEGSILHDDPLWTEYVEKAVSFDQRLVDDWNKIIDVTLIFVGLIISVLASFVSDSSRQFQPDPADVSNKLLVVIYNQLVALSENKSIPTIPTDTFSQLGGNDYKQAVICNALLYSSLGLCCVASVFALAAKLWLISYDHRASSVGTPYDRAMKRQRAYSGVLAWKMGAVIQSLPLILLVAIMLFGFFAHTLIWQIQKAIGYALGTLLALSVIALGITALAAAFIPDCPFHSSFSTLIQLFSTRFQEVCWRVERGLPFEGKTRRLRIGIIAFSWLASGSAIAWATIRHSSTYFPLVYIPITITFAYAMKQEVSHKAQKYRLPLLSLGCFVVIGSMLAAAGYFRNPQKYHIFIILYVVGMSFLFVFGWIASRLSKSMDKTSEIDAIAWLLMSTPSPTPELLKKVSRMASDPSSGRDYQPRLLKSLLPLLSSLIVSHPEGVQQQDLELYLSCLAQLSDFKNEDGSFCRLREDTRSHPRLGKMLKEKLVGWATLQSCRGRTATKILNSFGLDGQGKKDLELQKRKISGDAASMMTCVESVYSYEEVELHSRRKNGYYSVDG